MRINDNLANRHDQSKIYSRGTGSHRDSLVIKLLSVLFVGMTSAITAGVYREYDI